MSGHILTERLTTDTEDPQPDRRDVAGRRDLSRSRSTAWPRPMSLPARPRGHVVGRRIGEPPAQSFAGRPRGHVVGNAPSLPWPATYWEAAQPGG
jgi:hypothetical protein